MRPKWISVEAIVHDRSLDPTLDRTDAGMSLLVSNTKVPDVRSAHRANVFLAAVLDVAGSSFPVRVRNLSPTGALVDGRDLPGKGDAVRLQRGPYSAVARVMWCKAGACGLRFASAVPVQEWIAYGSGHTGQQGVDQMIASVRAGSAPADEAKCPTTIDRMQTVEQLQAVADQLQDAAESFAAIPAAVAEGSAALQSLEAARQRLVDLSTRMSLDEG